LGELCRFLLAQPVRPEEREHKIRLIMGNGMRAEIWNEFVNRFNIPKVAEFYGATEGNCNMTNFDGHPGAIGFFPAFTRFIMPVALVRVDENTGELLRDPKTGLAIECKPGELGELVAGIQRGHPVRDFPGYTDQESSNKKILRDVFKKGDYVFRAGDVMVKDELEYYYFRDRVGDTFRWKGENVSTMEVEAVVAGFCDNKDVAVYGVQIPGTDGRAGMAAIADPEGAVDLTVLANGLKASLPAYARPVFIRIIEKMELTGTFKLKKVDLQKDGINVDAVKDKLFILQGDTYVPLDKETHSKVMSGQQRL
jgi:solute carrier family 27 fatty acid transporter 1/4